ncbi:MAG TPA: hypothetical protein VGN73_12700 [Gemmatimonadaceae bacterium]|nr:hypothetical protein [Gemmatimonadaceae bacterium]
MFKWIMRLLSAAVVAVVVFGLWARKHYDSTSSPPTASSTSTGANTALPPRAGPLATTCGEPVLSDGGVGKVRIGTRVDSVESQCRVLKDAVQPGPEGMTERRVTVGFAEDSLEAEIVDDRVWRLDITSPRFRTADSLAVGSTLGDLLRHGRARGAVGEGRFFVLSSNHCGLSFELAGGIPAGKSRTWDQKELSTLPLTTRVKRILVVRPDESCRAPEVVIIDPARS